MAINIHFHGIKGGVGFAAVIFAGAAVGYVFSSYIHDDEIRSYARRNVSLESEVSNKVGQLKTKDAELSKALSDNAELRGEMTNLISPDKYQQIVTENNKLLGYIKEREGGCSAVNIQKFPYNFQIGASDKNRCIFNGLKFDIGMIHRGDGDGLVSQVSLRNVYNNMQVAFDDFKFTKTLLFTWDGASYSLKQKMCDINTCKYELDVILN